MRNLLRSVPTALLAATSSRNGFAATRSAGKRKNGPFRCPTQSTNVACPAESSSFNTALRAEPGDGNDEADTEGSGRKAPSFSMQEFLDRPFFDPDAVLDDNSDSERSDPLRIWFANLVKNDYELAETLYAGIFFVLLLLLAQELLRMQLYGDDYVPFVRGASRVGGRLF